VIQLFAISQLSREFAPLVGCTGVIGLSVVMRGVETAVGGCTSFDGVSDIFGLGVHPNTTIRKIMDIKSLIFISQASLIEF